MTIKPEIVNDFLEAVAQATQALRDRNFQEASRHTENTQLRGQLLSIHPEFVRQAQLRCPGVNAASLVDSVTQVLLCIAAAEGDARLPSLALASGMHNGQSGAR